MRDLGLFGPGSVTWRIHADPAALVGGLRALLIQALNPRAMAAVSQHSDYREDPWGRLQRTSGFLTDTIFGDTATAERAAARVRAVHRTVRGTDPVTGRRYSASDPKLLGWVHAVEVDSFLAAYRAYAAPLSDADADAYVAEMTRAGALVGLNETEMPSDQAGLAALLRAAEPGLALSVPAKEGMRLVLAPPMPLAYRPLWALAAAGAVATLPPPVRDLYGLYWPPPATLPLRPALWGLLRALNTLRPPPPPVKEAFEAARVMAQDVH